MMDKELILASQLKEVAKKGFLIVDDYVLIVDDDEDARRILSVIVKSLDLPFESAVNGLRGLERIKRRKPSLILLDLMMPEMDGFAMLASLQCDPDTRHIPVVVVTACTRDQIDMLQLPGVKNVVPKGDLLDLRGVLEKLLHKGSPTLIAG